MALLKEFKEFALKGNVVDLAIAVIIGATFGKIVSSFVDNVLMPSLCREATTTAWPLRKRLARRL